MVRKVLKNPVNLKNNLIIILIHKNNLNLVKTVKTMDIIINQNIQRIISLTMLRTTGPIMIRLKDQLKHIQKVMENLQVKVDQVDLMLLLKVQKVQAQKLHTNIVMNLLVTIGHLIKTAKVKNKTSPTTGLIRKLKTTMPTQLLKVRENLQPKLLIKLQELLLKVKMEPKLTVILTTVLTILLITGPK